MSQKRFYQKTKPENQKLTRMTEMRREPEQDTPIKKQKDKHIVQKQSQHDNNDGLSCNNCCGQSRLMNFLYAWGYFIIAFLVFILVWVIGHFSIERLTSHYYLNDFNISPYANLDIWKTSMRATNASTQVYISSKALYIQEELKKADSIALSLFFSWLMWKLPLTIFTLKILRHKSHQVLRYSTFGFYLVLLLLIDIMTTVFQPQGYPDWIFFLIYFILSIILIGINDLRNRKKLLSNLTNFFLPTLYIVLAYASFTLFIPALYGAMYKGVGSDAPSIIVHVFPFIDLICYSLIILMTYICQAHTIKFIKMFYFLNTGYAVGHILLFSPDEVQFYYLVTYFAIRNLSTNWIIQKVQKYVINPSPLPGWLMIYLVSLSINFIPFVGVGRLVVSKSFYSQILQITLPIVRYIMDRDYFIYYSDNLPAIQPLNGSLNSNVQISGVFIIWVVFTITQKYHISKIQFKEIFFYIFGIYMFYFGLTTGIQLYYLQSNNF